MAVRTDAATTMATTVEMALRAVAASQDGKAVATAGLVAAVRVHRETMSVEAAAAAAMGAMVIHAAPAHPLTPLRAHREAHVAVPRAAPTPLEAARSSSPTLVLPAAPAPTFMPGIHLSGGVASGALVIFEPARPLALSPSGSSARTPSRPPLVLTFDCSPTHAVMTAAPSDTATAVAAPSAMAVSRCGGPALA